MFVCSCRAVKERTVRAAIASGADTIDDVGLRCGAGTVCGGCHELIDELLAQATLARGARSDSAA